EPNLVNVVARTARLTVDLRNTDETELQSAEAKLVAFLGELAEREGVTIERRTLARFEPVAFDERMIGLVEATAERLGHKVRRLPSGAGHDAQMMARICPTAMVFVPSVGGISHNPAEYTSPGDLTAGTQVLLEVMCRLASGPTDPDQLYEM
ncbi:MAG TPA: M20/M25/M40 family metallo-hydrolase, partial [Microthrixaceae bacterium]|nr:M20/M25/M40 family metallo-hydrolase [Microthrixaceae bacterium]